MPVHRKSFAILPFSHRNTKLTLKLNAMLSRFTLEFISLAKTIRRASKRVILTQREQKLELVNLKCIIHIQPISYANRYDVVNQFLCP